MNVYTVDLKHLFRIEGESKEEVKIYLLAKLRSLVRHPDCLTEKEIKRVVGERDRWIDLS